MPEKFLVKIKTIPPLDIKSPFRIAAVGFDSTGVPSYMLNTNWVEKELFSLALCGRVRGSTVVCVVCQGTAGTAGQCDLLTCCHHWRRSELHFQS